MGRRFVVAASFGSTPPTAPPPSGAATTGPRRDAMSGVSPVSKLCITAHFDGSFAHLQAQVRSDDFGHTPRLRLDDRIATSKQVSLAQAKSCCLIPGDSIAQPGCGTAPAHEGRIQTERRTSKTQARPLANSGHNYPMFLASPAPAKLWIRIHGESSHFGLHQEFRHNVGTIRAVQIV